MEIHFVFDKETASTYRFRADSDDPFNAPAVETLYIKKSALKSLDYKQGDAIKITISKEEN